MGKADWTGEIYNAGQLLQQAAAMSEMGFRISEEDRCNIAFKFNRAVGMNTDDQARELKAELNRALAPVIKRFQRRLAAEAAAMLRGVRP